MFHLSSNPSQMLQNENLLLKKMFLYNPAPSSLLNNVFIETYKLI